MALVYSYPSPGRNMFDRNSTKWCTLAALVSCSAFANGAPLNAIEVTSPDHRIVLRFSVQSPRGKNQGRTASLFTLFPSRKARF